MWLIRKEANYNSLNKGRHYKKQQDFGRKECGNAAKEEEMGNNYELDELNANEILTNLDLGGYEPSYIEIGERKEEENSERFAYYRKLQESGEEIEVKFTSSNRGRLSVIKDDICLVYSRGFLGDRYRREDAVKQLSKTYTLNVRNVDEKGNTVYLYSKAKEDAKKRIIRQIDEKLKDGEKVYLRGQIVSLQYETHGGHQPGTAAYVDINGLGIVGIIPCGKWTSGYIMEETFREQVNKNVGLLVNFRVLTKAEYNGEIQYLCDRRDYLRAVGIDPWNRLAKFYRPKMNVKVKIMAPGKSPDCFFGALEGIDELQFLCYLHKDAKMRSEDVKVGQEYYGFIQKMNIETRFARIRLTSPVEDVQNLHE